MEAERRSPDEKLQLYRCDVAQEQFAEPAFLFSELNRVPISNSLAARRATVAAIFADPRNGRMPRTLVNRFWERLLGRGLVENSDEMDGEPWSADLLDWLASDFVEHGYNLKHLIATIVSSRAYQMPAVARNSELPHEYVFRGPEIRRITAEQFVDAIGSITGDWHVYQPPFTAVAGAGAVSVAPAGRSANLFASAHIGAGDPGNPGTRDLAPVAATGGTAAPHASGPPPGAYTREWRVAATSLTRGLGRSIRDQVISSRDNQATTLQALELVNGESLTHWLSRGARKMLGELPPEPVSVFEKTIAGRNAPTAFDIDVSKATKLWLLVQDTGSYSPEKVEAVWARAELIGRDGTTPVSSLKPG